MSRMLNAKLATNPFPETQRPLHRLSTFIFLVAWEANFGSGCGGSEPSLPDHQRHVIEIDIDDHGLSGLWMAHAPNVKGLIARGTLAYSRVIVPTHSNQNNMALLTGQYPDGNSVPSNSWLARALDFAPPVNLPGIDVGDYAVYGNNPLLVRGDSVYRAVGRAGAAAGKTMQSAYFGQLPPFEAGADDVHLTINGATIGSITVTPSVAALLLTTSLGYPKDVVNRYHFDGPAAAGESYTRFTMRDAALRIRASSPASPVPRFMFIWDFLALSDDPTGVSGADGPGLIAAIEDYDEGLGELLSALAEKRLIDDTDILFTLDHGKVDTHSQVALGTRGGDASLPGDGQLGSLVATRGAALGITPADYAMLNEDGDALIYARIPSAGTPAGASRQKEVTHALLSLLQSGEIVGLDTSRTMTADGALGTRRFQDFRASGPNQADIIVFPLPDWTLNRVDSMNTDPGPFQEHTQFPYGRHGGFSVDELYVPLILAGPSFKRGVVIPHPVEHPQVASTAMWALDETRLTTAARGPITTALLGDPGETLPLPDPATLTRDAILTMSGYAGTPALAGSPARSAVVIDVAGLYDDEVFVDPALAVVSQPLRDLAGRGVRFQDFWTQSRDWPVTEYALLAGGLPTADMGVTGAEDDPAQSVAPGAGLLKMPPVAGFVANRAGYEAWRNPEHPFATPTLFDAARSMGMTTAIVGQPDFHAIHVDPAEVDMNIPSDMAGCAEIVADLLATHPRALIVVALGQERTGDRHAAPAAAELGAIAAAVGDVVAGAGDALVVLTSRGATTIDDPRADFYGSGTSRHVPFVILGPNVRAGVVSGQPGAPADLPATVLFALGALVSSDFVTGTWATGIPTWGIPQPSPPGATAGHALVRAFEVAQ